MRGYSARPITSGWWVIKDRAGKTVWATATQAEAVAWISKQKLLGSKKPLPTLKEAAAAARRYFCRGGMRYE